MPEQPIGTAELIARELTLAFKPLETQFASGNIRHALAALGLRLPETLESHPAFMNAVGDAIAQCAHIPDLVTRLKNAIQNEDLGEAIHLVIEIGTFVANITSDIQTIASELDSLSGSFAGVDVAEIQAFALELPKKLAEYLIIYHLEGYFPIFASVLNILGLIEYEEIEGSGTNISQSPYLKRNLRFDRIGDFLSSPSTYFQTLYGWGDPSFDGQKLIKNLYQLLFVIGIPVLYHKGTGPGDVPSLSLGFLKAQTSSGSQKGLELQLHAAFSGSIDLRIPFIQSNWFINLHGAASIEAGTGITVLPSGRIELIPPSGTVSGQLGIYYLAVPPAGSPYFVLLGQAAGSRISCGQIKFGVASNFQWDAGAGKAVGDFAVEASMTDCAIILDMSSSDGFIGKLLSGVHVEAHFDLLAGISTRRGFYFSGSSALEIRLPLHVALGPVSFEGLTLTLKPEAGQIPVTLGADIKASIGPMVAVVQNIGMSATFSFPSDHSGNLGPVQLDLGFKPPNGVGLSLDTGVIKGGGFLYLDFDKGEYFGALELTFQGVIALKAVGIINTKMPDGTKGFALLILITAEFTPIQLGFGFTLNGVGGLVGVNRSTDLESLRAGVRTGAVSSILFPQDVVANITRIISDLKAIFPIVPDHFLIAPMAKLGWGTPTLISLELGIIIDIPEPRIVIIGVLRCILPDEQASILKLKVAFAGGIDFNEGLIWFDATLFDSQILLFTLTGDMALRIGWKNPLFIISVGGFHPAFHEVPSDLTSMRRITLALLSGDNPRITAQIYFAITSNTVQSGARVELYAEAAGFNIYGYLGYDLLIQFSPFHFIADIYAGLALRSGSSEIAGIHVHCQLSGPTPWHAVGDASLELLFFSISVGFDVTWGETGPSQPDEIENVLQKVIDALEDQRNWKADLPSNTSQSVTLKKIELADEHIIIHPFGVLSVSQKVVPLGITINKFGNKKPGADTLFNLTYSGSSSKVQEEFAIANFIQMSDSDKLARKSFEKIDSGLQFSSDDSTNHGYEIHKEVVYELSYVHNKQTSRWGKFHLFDSIFHVLVSGTSIFRNTNSVSKKNARGKPTKIEVNPNQYSVVNTTDLNLLASGMTTTSEAEAFAMHDQLLRENPGLKGKIQVMSSFELN